MGALESGLCIQPRAFSPPHPLTYRPGPASIRAMSYAIFRAAGKQFRAEKGSVLRIPSIPGDPGSKVTFDEVLLWSDGEKVKAGQPAIEGARVTAEILRHGKDRKIVVFKFKRRKNYRRKAGHRQGFTEIKVTEVKA